MNIQDVAEKLDGVEYREEDKRFSEEELRSCGIVVAYGYSDDGVTFRGAISDEKGCWEGGIYYIDKLKKDILDCKDYLKDNIEVDEIGRMIDFYIDTNCIKIDIKIDKGYWEYKMKGKVETFDVMEDGELYCKGIVFDLNK